MIFFCESPCSKSIKRLENLSVLIFQSATKADRYKIVSLKTLFFNKNYFKLKILRLTLYLCKKVNEGYKILMKILVNLQTIVNSLCKRLLKRYDDRYKIS